MEARKIIINVLTCTFVFLRELLLKYDFHQNHWIPLSGIKNIEPRHKIMLCNCYLKPGFHMIATIAVATIARVVSIWLQRSQEWFPYDRNDRCDHCDCDRCDHMETRLKQTLQELVVPSKWLHYYYQSKDHRFNRGTLAAHKCGQIMMMMMTVGEMFTFKDHQSDQTNLKT